MRGQADKKPYKLCMQNDGNLVRARTVAGLRLGKVGLKEVLHFWISIWELV